MASKAIADMVIKETKENTWKSNSGRQNTLQTELWQKAENMLLL
jgi:hypothetical protein